jgi:molybdate transport system permease protein
VKKGRSSAILAVPAVLGFALLVLPAIALAVRTPWRRLGSIITQVEVRQALVLSLVTSTSATILALALGVPLAWWLAHGSKKLSRILRSLVLMPLVMPPVVGGVALLQLLGRRGVLGGPLYRLTGYSIPFTTVAVVIAEAFVAMPFLVLAVEGAFAQVPSALEEAATVDGASAFQAFRKVLVPSALPGIGAGMLLCWARALGEFGATITFAGSFPGRTRTLPLEVYLALETDPAGAIALSLCMVLLSIAIVVGLRGRWAGGLIKP